MKQPLIFDGSHMKQTLMFDGFRLIVTCFPNEEGNMFKRLMYADFFAVHARGNTFRITKERNGCDFLKEHFPNMTTERLGQITYMTFTDNDMVMMKLASPMVL